MSNQIAEWKAISVVAEGNEVEINGLNLWRYPWVESGEKVDLPHPSHSSQRYNMHVYLIERENIKFAASEVSNGVWAFYVPNH